MLFFNFKHLRQRGSQLEREAASRIVGYIVASFGLVAGLAWNEAIKAIIEHLFPLSTETLWAKIMYAVLITLLVVLISFYAVRFAHNTEQKK